MKKQFIKKLTVLALVLSLMLGLLSVGAMAVEPCADGSHSPDTNHEYQAPPSSCAGGYQTADGATVSGYYRCTACGSLCNAEGRTLTWADGDGQHTLGALQQANYKNCAGGYKTDYYQCTVCHQGFDANGNAVVWESGTGSHTAGTRKYNKNYTACSGGFKEGYYLCTVCGQPCTQDGNTPAYEAGNGQHTKGEKREANYTACNGGFQTPYYICSVCGFAIDENGNELSRLEGNGQHTRGSESHPANYTSCSGGFQDTFYPCTVCSIALDASGNRMNFVQGDGQHTIVSVPEQAPTYETVGYAAHYECSQCHIPFKDAKGTVVITMEEIEIPRLQDKYTKFRQSHNAYLINENDYSASAVSLAQAWETKAGQMGRQTQLWDNLQQTFIDGMGEQESLEVTYILQALEGANGPFGKGVPAGQQDVLKYAVVDVDLCYWNDIGDNTCYAERLGSERFPTSAVKSTVVEIQIPFPDEFKGCTQPVVFTNRDYVRYTYQPDEYSWDPQTCILTLKKDFAHDRSTCLAASPLGPAQAVHAWAAYSEDSQAVSQELAKEWAVRVEKMDPPKNLLDYIWFRNLQEDGMLSYGDKARLFYGLLETTLETDGSVSAVAMRICPQAVLVGVVQLYTSGDFGAPLTITVPLPAKMGATYNSILVTLPDAAQDAQPLVRPILRDADGLPYIELTTQVWGEFRMTAGNAQVVKPDKAEIKLDENAPQQAVEAATEIAEQVAQLPPPDTLMTALTETYRNNLQDGDRLTLTYTVQDVRTDEDDNTVSIAVEVFPILRRANGSEEKVENSNLSGNVMFRIPVPSKMAAQYSYATVKHNGQAMPGAYTIHDREGAPYIEVTTDSFSLFEVTGTNTPSTPAPVTPAAPTSNVPKTSGATHSALWGMLTLLSTGGLGVLGLGSKKWRK